MWTEVSFVQDISGILQMAFRARESFRGFHWRNGLQSMRTWIRDLWIWSPPQIHESQGVRRERADQLILHMFFNVQNENWWTDQGHTGRSWETTKGGSFRLVIVLSTASAHCASILFEFLSFYRFYLRSGVSSHFKGRVGFLYWIWRMERNNCTCVW